MFPVLKQFVVVMGSVCVLVGNAHAAETPPSDRVKCEGLYLTSQQCEDAKRTGSLKKSPDVVNGDKFRCEALYLNQKECDNAKKGIDIKNGTGTR